MIELASFLVVLIGKCFLISSPTTDPIRSWDLAATMNSLMSLTLVFILFTRIVMKVTLDKVLPANNRYKWLCIFYYFLLWEGCLAVMFFGGELDREDWKVVKILAQIFLYSCSLAMVVFMKIWNFKESVLYGPFFKALHVLDTFLIGILFLIDFTITPEGLIKSQFLVDMCITVLFFLVVINTALRKYKEYWFHKNTLLKIITNLVLTKQEKELTTPLEKNLKMNKTYQEIATVLNLSPVRALEVFSLVKNYRDILVGNNHTVKKANELSSKFCSAIIVNLMKRKYDFSILPTNWLLKLEKHQRCIKNRRGQLYEE